MISEQELRTITTRLRKTQTGYSALASQLETIINTSREQLSGKQVDTITALLNEADDHNETVDDELIDIRDDIKKSAEEG